MQIDLLHQLLYCDIVAGIVTSNCDCSIIGISLLYLFIIILIINLIDFKLTCAMDIVYLLPERITDLTWI